MSAGAPVTRDARRKLVLVDGSGYLYRAFHALPPLANSRGEPTGAVLGVLNMLQKLCKEESPELMAVVFDAPGRTFRDELFEAYKAQRTPMPDDLRSQLQPLLDAVTAMGLPLVRIDGVEADDVIGTLAKRAAARGIDVLISTGDKDMAQLVDGRITLVNTMTGSRLDREGVKLKFGVYPEQIIDYLALVGDSIDNIPGIDKVGPKTASKWLNDYGTLDNLLANAAAITGKVGENLRAGGATLELSRKLATLDCNVPLDYEPESLLRRAANQAALRSLYTRLEFRSLLRQLGEGGAAAADAFAPAESAPAAQAERPPRSYETVLTADALRSWVERLQACEELALAIKSTSLDYMQAEIIGVAFCVEPNTAAYVPLAHDYAGVPEQLGADVVLEALRPILECERPAKIGHHLKYHAHALRRYGLELRGGRFDTMLESYVLNSTATRHELDVSARRYLGFDMIRYEDIAGRGAKQIPFSQVSLDAATTYAAESADVALQLHRALSSKLAETPTLMRVYQEIEQPLVPVLFRMEQAGVLIDGDLLRQQSNELALRMREVQEQAYRAAGGPFSLESPKQLQEILFVKLKLPVARKTPTGQPSTAEDVLEELAEQQYELPRLILDYRGVAKLKST